MTRLRDDTLACLRDMAQQFNIEEGLVRLANFCDVVPATALVWLYEEKLPQGLTLLKLRLFLELHDYEVTEYRELPRPARHFAQLLAFNVISPEEAKELLDYADTTAVYRIVLAGTRLTSERAYKLGKMVDSREEQRLSALQRWTSEFAAVQPVEVQTDQVISAVVTESSIADVVPQPDLPAPLAVALLEQHLQSAAMLIEFLDSHHDDWLTSYFQPPAYSLGKARLNSLADAMSDALDQM